MSMERKVGLPLPGRGDLRLAAGGRSGIGKTSPDYRELDTLEFERV